MLATGEAGGLDVEEGCAVKLVWRQQAWDETVGKGCGAVQGFMESDAAVLVGEGVELVAEGDGAERGMAFDDAWGQEERGLRSCLGGGHLGSLEQRFFMSK